MKITIEIPEGTDLTKDFTVQVKAPIDWCERLFKELDDSVDLIVKEAHRKLDVLKLEYVPVGYLYGTGISISQLSRYKERERNAALSQMAMAAQMNAKHIFHSGLLQGGGIGQIGLGGLANAAARGIFS